ncbi:MAG: hypothetical protein JKY15_01350 [Deltaproteobacteria bacterium]|nr:hypothetical protein [Deltaproteobacteria bacterium]
MEENLHRDTQEHGEILPNRTLLLPINLANQHWIGLLVHIQQGQAATVEYFDTLTQRPQVPDWIQGVIRRVYGTETTPASNLQQEDGNACGPLMIENLIQRAAGLLGRPLTFDITDAALIRRRHALLMYHNEREQPNNFIHEQAHQALGEFPQRAAQVGAFVAPWVYDYIFGNSKFETIGVIEGGV